MDYKYYVVTERDLMKGLRNKTRTVTEVIEGKVRKRYEKPLKNIIVSKEDIGATLICVDGVWSKNTDKRLHPMKKAQFSGTAQTRGAYSYAQQQAKEMLKRKVSY